MKYLRITYRLTALALLSISGLVLMGIYSPRSQSRKNDQNVAEEAKDVDDKKHLGITQKQKNIREWWLKKVVAIVGITLTVEGDSHKGSALWVANHVSWLDIPIIGSEGAAFLSKAEIRKWPVIGWLAEKGGTVFIQRGGKNASQNASAKISETIKAGDRILIFPEATTGNGYELKQFHARMFAPAIDHQLSVQPIAIRYLDTQGGVHPAIFWGDESFMSNLMSILGASGIHVELTFFPILEGHKFSERKHLAEHAENQVREVVEKTKLR